MQIFRKSRPSRHQFNVFECNNPRYAFSLPGQASNPNSKKKHLDSMLRIQNCAPQHSCVSLHQDRMRSYLIHPVFLCCCVCIHNDSAYIAYAFRKPANSVCRQLFIIKNQHKRTKENYRETNNAALSLHPKRAAIFRKMRIRTTHRRNREESAASICCAV